MGFLTVYEHLRTGFMGTPGSFAKQAIDTGKRRVAELDKVIEAATSERNFWSRLVDHFRPCIKCGGGGRLVYLVDQDETRSEDCPDCKGEGVSAAPTRIAGERTDAR